MQSWAYEELNTCHFGDQRLTKRLIRMVDRLTNAPSASVPEAFQAWGQIKAAYRFWDSDAVSPEAILMPHQQHTTERASHYERVLALQDTTALDYSTHRKTTGLGYLYTEAGYGLFLHNTLAVTTDGVPLGLLHQKFWQRPVEQYGKKHTAKKRPVEEKESYRWIEALNATADLMPDTVEVITVADREADFYDLFTAPRPANAHLLIRAMHDRSVNGERGRLIPTVEAAAPCGSLAVEIGRGDERAPRTAVLTLRHCTVELLPPKRKGGRTPEQTVRIKVVLAREERAPEGELAIEWLLLTTLPLEHVEDVQACVLYYSRRWLIERFHYVLKQGCRVEVLQLERAERLERAAATYSLVAWRLLWLLYASRAEPEASCACAFEPVEWQALYVKVHHRAPPVDVPSLEMVVLWLARLGGFIGRKHDGKPGIVVLWRGLRRLNDITETWCLAQSLSPPLMGKA